MSHRETVLGISQPFLGGIGSDCEDIRSIYGISLGGVTKRAYLWLLKLWSENIWLDTRAFLGKYT